MRKVPGVALVLHAFNMPRIYQNIKLGSGPPNRTLFPLEVFMVGTVAVVLAESQDIADEAMRLINVQYEILPAAVDYLESMNPGAPKQWDNNLDGTIVGISKPFSVAMAAPPPTRRPTSRWIPSQPSRSSSRWPSS